MTKNNEGFTHRNFAAVLQKYKYDLNLGDIVAGTIFSFELNGVPSRGPTCRRRLGRGG